VTSEERARVDWDLESIDVGDNWSKIGAPRTIIDAARIWGEAGEVAIAAAAPDRRGSRTTRPGPSNRASGKEPMPIVGAPHAHSAHV
jgi:hypothetical protein